jgi:RNA polymerase sigma factor (sigma-70 family)
MRLRTLRLLFEYGTFAGHSDRQLLEFYTTRRGEASELAFAALVERHGSMVLRVCQKAARDAHDAEDAFQATFMIFARRSRSLWVRDSLGPWLHRVAYRAAARAKRVTEYRRMMERRAAEMAALRAVARVPDEIEFLLHQEIDRLPERYRSPIILCDLEGHTYEEAARHLDCPVGTIRSRLARARRRMRTALVSRGLAPSAGALLLSFASESAKAAVPAELRNSAIRTAMFVAAGKTAARDAIPATVIALTNGGLRSMLLFKMKMVAFAVFLLGALTAGAAWTAMDDDANTQAQPGGRTKAATNRGGKGKEETEKQPAPDRMAQLQRLQMFRNIVEPEIPSPANGVRVSRVFTTSGSGRGPFALLLMSPKIQEELKLTDAQRERLKSISSTRQDRMRKLMESDDGGIKVSGGGLKLGGIFEEMQQENEALLSELLKPQQAKRLAQIVLQINGFLSLVDAQIAVQAGLLPEQLETVQQIAAEMKTAQHQARVAVMPPVALANGMTKYNAPAAPGNRDAGAAPPSDEPAAPRALSYAAAKNPTNGAPGTATAPLSAEESRARFRKLTEEQENVWGKAMSRIAGSLSAAQRATFKRMMGKSVDLSRL